MSDQNTKKTIQELIIDGETYVFNATYLKNGDSKFDLSDIKTINGEAIIESGGGDIVTPITYGEVEGSAVLKGGNNTVTGKYSAAIGYGNTVKNDSIVAFGYNNKVKANCCFSDGSNNEVSGENSHVSGRECIVEGHESHAEGNYTKVYGHCSHGEGTSCRVLGDNSHVEGHSSVVYGHIGHAEGQYCAAGDLGQIEKPSSERTDAACHAEGIRTTAKEMASHSEGIDTHSMGVASHAEGRGSYTSGDASHAEGLNTKSGIKGFYFKGIDIKNKKIYLSTTKPDTIKTSGFSTSDFENIDFPYDIEADMLSIINGNIYYDCLKVTQIKNKSVIYVESLPFTSVAEFNELFKNSNYTIFCLSKYKLGAVSVSFGCHSEGYETRSFGFGSHSDGYNTIAKNVGEHASGIYNVSNGDTQFSIGVGTSEDDRKNAFEVKQNGDIYIKGIGGYTGNNHVESKDVATVINNIEHNFEKKHPVISLVHNDIENSKSTLDLIYSLIKDSNTSPYIQGFVSNITSETAGAIVGSYTIFSVGVTNDKATAIIKVIGGSYAQGLNSYLVTVLFSADVDGNYSDLEVITKEEFNSSNMLERISELENIINNLNYFTVEE